MLINFKVDNFLSFSSEQVLSFHASNDRSHRATHCVHTASRAVPYLARNALIAGANASGKSNLLLALQTMRDLVLHSTSHEPSQFVAHYRPFISPALQDHPTTFQIELLLANVRYQYGFSYNSERIVSEYMRVYPGAKSQRWFERQVDCKTGSETWSSFSASFRGPREMWRQATRPQALFLTLAAQLNSSQFRPIMDWFEHQLTFVLSPAALDAEAFGKHLERPEFKSQLLGILRASDLPITDIRMTEKAHPVAHNDLSNVVRKNLVTSIELQYGRQDLRVNWIDVIDSSSGVRRLLSLLSALIDGVERDRLVVIDNIDAYLHPLMARLLIRLINDPAATHRRVQVLMVSDTTALMDLEILRRDEIWLMDTDTVRASHLTVLAGKKAGKRALVAKDYLAGDYGGVPRIDVEKLSLAASAKTT